jgi:hypothetical protein
VDDQLFIPSRVKVGYNKRDDTYTGKLGYVIYFDANGKLRKESSWEKWRQKNLGQDEYDNVPTEGFVLNKDVGGKRHSYSDWHGRMEKVRVFDPRNFEFEISIPNVLFILTNCTSTKGKGLEGQFVYAWAGTELILLPIDCEEYRQSQKFSAGLAGKVSTKELVPGCTYLSKRQNELVYLGKFGWSSRATYAYEKRGLSFELKTGHVFYNPKPDKDGYQPEDQKFILFSSPAALSARTNDTPVDNYADLLHQFNQSEHNALVKDVKVAPFHFDFNEQERSYHYYRWGEIGVGFQEVEPNVYRSVKVTATATNDGSYRYGGYYKFAGYKISASKIITFGANGEVAVKDDSKAKADNKLYTRAELDGMNLKSVKVQFKGSNKEYTLKV